MWDMNDVVSIEYRGDFVYWLQFDDGSNGEVDFADYSREGTVFERFRDPGFFRSARIEGGTISWPNGADIAPETLYEQLGTARAP